MPHDPPDFLAAKRAQRREEERLRAEYFARGGTITRYPMHVYGKYRVAWNRVIEREKPKSD